MAHKAHVLVVVYVALEEDEVLEVSWGVEFGFVHLEVLKEVLGDDQEGDCARVQSAEVVSSDVQRELLVENLRDSNAYGVEEHFESVGFG